MRTLGAAAVLASMMLTVAGVAGAQAKKSGASKPKSGNTQVGSGTHVFPAGAKMAVESGDPSKAEEFMVRLSFPAGTISPPHFHPTDEHVRVHRESFPVGMGDQLDASKTKKLAACYTGTTR